MSEETAHKKVDTDKEEILHQIQDLRRQFLLVMSLLMLTVGGTIVFGTLENPFHYTFSKIGNYFPYREWYIIWAILTGVSVQIAVVFMFKLENYEKLFPRICIYSATFFLIVTALIPSLRVEMPFWHAVHKWTTFFYVMSMIFALCPYLYSLTLKKPHLQTILRNWALLILIGSMSSLIIQGQTGIFELWFIILTVLLLSFLAFRLYRDKINGLKDTSSG
ncbi:MAG: hypothetical protein K0B52_02395 [FCB group bacterium]|nr:hypothetical protein [FCB group bacterium]